MDTTSEPSQSGHAVKAILDHEDVRLEFNLLTGAWSAKISANGAIVRSQVACTVHGKGGGRVDWPLVGSRWTEEFRGQISVENVGDFPGLRLVASVPTLLTSPNHENRQRITVTFVVAQYTLLWKASLSGLDKNANIDHLVLFDGSWSKPASAAPGPNHVHVHGWQSWSYCGSLPCRQGQIQPDITLPNFLNAAFHNRERGRLGKSLRKPFRDMGHQVFEGDMFMPIGYSATQVLSAQHFKQADSLVLFGFLAQRKQFGTVRADSTTGGENKLTMTCGADGVLVTPERTLETDWACIMHRSFIAESDFVHWHDYLDLVADHCDVKANGAERAKWSKSMPLTWCSWYKFGPNINTQLLSSQAAAAVKSKFEMFLVDDGWSPFWGDWEFTDPQDEASLCKQLDEGTMIPGLWMAPFAADFQSLTVKRRLDLVLRNRVDGNGKPCNSSYPAKYFAGLDATHPDVLYHVERSLSERAKHFKYLKLDFLYAAVLRDYTGKNHANNRFDPTKTRAEAMVLAMQAMRRGAGPETFILGCGCPIGSAVGFMDGMRLGCDVGHTWAPAFPLPSWDKTNIPCMRNSVRDVLCRSSMNGRWFVGDPDCILLSSPRLTLDEIHSVASVSAVLGGLVSVSDDLLLTKTEQRMEVALRVYPTFNEPFQALDLMTSEIPEVFLYRTDDDSEVGEDSPVVKIWLVCFNWTERKSKSFHLSFASLFGHTAIPEVVHVFEHWTSVCGLQPLQTAASPSFESDSVPFHGVRFFALSGVRQAKEFKSVIPLGSDIHFGGKEIVSFVEEGLKTTLEVKTFRDRTPSRLFFAVPDNATASFKGATVVQAHRSHPKSPYYAVEISGSGLIEADLSIDA